MTNRDTKEVVVIKNINSSVIEEAIFILKSKPEKSGSKSVHQRISARGSEREHIMKEAQAVIDTYIREHNLEIKPIRGKDRRVRIFNRHLSLNLVINTVLALGVISLVFFITRLI